MLPFALIAFGLTAGASQSPAAEHTRSEHIRGACPDIEAAPFDGMAYVVQRPKGPSRFVQPAPVAMPVQRGSDSRDSARLSLDAPADFPGLPTASHVFSMQPATETAGLATEGRSRHRWLQTYRC